MAIAIRCSCSSLGHSRRNLRSPISSPSKTVCPVSFSLPRRKFSSLAFSCI
ncbi:NB-ARC domain-containing protein [Psidium guajava]|nr:NB-ARC domain-containing protein [Psidium guajava]